MNSEYIAITQYEGEGYKPMIDFASWRVAILRYCEELEIQNLKTMQKHNETDEVFILIEGNCILFSGEKGDNIGKIDGVKMEPLKLYNVKKGVWHTHTLDKKGMVVIVENRDTNDSNSPTKSLNLEQLEQLYKVYGL